MTTIAYRDGKIACDSRITSGMTIVSDSRDKRFVKGEWQLFVCGGDNLVEELLDTWPNLGELSGNDFGAYAYINGCLYLIGADDDGKVWRCPMPMDEYGAIGSGADHALTAMDMGCTAKQAVKMAATRDCCTGGKIRVYEVPYGAA